MTLAQSALQQEFEERGRELSERKRQEGRSFACTLAESAIREEYEERQARAALLKGEH